LQALAGSSNTAAGTSQPQAKPTEPATPAAAVASTPAIINEPARTGKISVGGGAFFDWSRKNGVEVLGSKLMGSDLVSIGAYGFLDTKFFELSIGPSYGMWTLELGGLKQKSKLLQIDINLLGKLPIDLPGGKFSFSPMLGISYNQPVFEISGDSITGGIYDLGQLGVLGGVGLDINLTKSVYLRSEGLVHFRLPYWATIDVIGQSGTKIDFGTGPRIKLGIGYRL